MPCNSCIPPPPIFDIPPPPDPSLILHLLIEDIQQQQHSFRPQQFYSCLKPPFPSFLSKLLFGAHPQQIKSYGDIPRNISTPSCCYGSSEIYEELATDYQEDIAEPPYLKRLVNNRLPPPITRPPSLPPEQFNNNCCCCCEKEGEKSGKEEIKQKINNFGNNKSENKFPIKTPPNNLPKWMSTENEKQNKGMLSSPNIWTSTKENNEYICRQKRTYV
uniref:Uncharacterized protein n=1 Tax=Meloidogyne javanica TaxID=6303 RepID=A0A915ME10_MELJA